MLLIKNLFYKKNNKALMNNISITFENGEIAGITGPAGSGKNTLINLIRKKEKNYSGNICIDSCEIGKISNKKFSKLISHNSPLTDNFNPEAIVSEWILGGRMSYKKILNPYSETDKDTAYNEMKNFGMAQASGTRLKEISWTSGRMASLARTFASQSDIILLEKPEAGLNLYQRNLLSKNIKKYTVAGNRIVILTSCDLNFLAGTCDRLIVLADTHVAESGSNRIITEDFVRKYFNVEVVVTKNIISGLPEIQIIEGN